MNSYKTKLAGAVLFAFAVAAQAQTSSESTANANTNSSSVGIGLGGGASLNQISNNTTTSIGGTSLTSSLTGGNSVSSSNMRNSGNSSSNSGVKSSGNSNVSVNVSLAQASTGADGTPGASTGATSKAAVGDPGSSPYNTNSRVEYSGTQTVKTNPAIQAPGLTTTLSDTCMGSLSVGLSLPGFGATGGTTMVDQACVRRLDAREFRAMGLTDVALALLCQADANRRAVEATGHLCPGTTAPLAKATGAANPTATVSDDEQYRDPLVRARLGLPALDEKPAEKKKPTAITKQQEEQMMQAVERAEKQQVAVLH